MSKKGLAVIMALILLLSICGCSSETDSNKSPYKTASCGSVSMEIPRDWIQSNSSTSSGETMQHYTSDDFSSCLIALNTKSASVYDELTKNSDNMSEYFLSQLLSYAGNISFDDMDIIKHNNSYALEFVGTIRDSGSYVKGAVLLLKQGTFTMLVTNSENFSSTQTEQLNHILDTAAG